MTSFTNSPGDNNTWSNINVTGHNTGDIGNIATSNLVSSSF
jgi:hypothetical protein